VAQRWTAGEGHSRWRTARAGGRRGGDPHGLLITAATKLNAMARERPETQVFVPRRGGAAGKESVAILEIVYQLLGLSVLPRGVHERVGGMTFRKEEGAAIKKLQAAFSGPGGDKATSIDVTSAITLATLYDATLQLDKTQLVVAAIQEELQAERAKVQANVIVTNTGGGGQVVAPPDVLRPGPLLEVEQLPRWTPDVIKQQVFAPGLFQRTHQSMLQSEVTKWCKEAEVLTEGGDDGYFNNFNARIQRQAEFLEREAIPGELQGLYAVACMFAGVSPADTGVKSLQAKKLVLQAIGLRSPVKEQALSAEIGMLCNHLAMVKHGKTEIIRICHAYGITHHPSMTAKLKAQSVEFVIRSGASELQMRMLEDGAAFVEIDNWNILAFEKILKGTREPTLHLSQEEVDEVAKRVEDMSNKDLQLCSCSSKPLSRCQNH